MTKQKFELILQEKNIDYKIDDGKIIITDNQEYVDLESLTSLPEGIQFNNQGSVYLESLTSLPDGIQFNNQGGVDLRSLTSLPEGIQFNNQGSVDLESLTSLPDGIQFNNQGGVDLRSLNGIYKYKNKKIELKTIDGDTMLIESKKQKDDYIIMKCRYFGGGDLDKLKKCFVVESGEYYSHGETIKQAIEDVTFKKLSQNFDLNELIADIKERGNITINDYRLITGACKAGVNHFLESNGLQDKENLPIDKVIDLTRGSYGHDRFVEVLG
jgi:virulence-associated protein VapD